MDIPTPPSLLDPAQIPAVPTPIPEQAQRCPFCHQPLPVIAFFCPICGKALAGEQPLSTSIESQIWLYAFSIILPIICFIAVTKWQGIKYARSSDLAARRIGMIAIALISLSTIISFWYATVWINQQLQSAESSVGSLGNLGGF